MKLAKLLPIAFFCLFASCKKGEINETQSKNTEVLSSFSDQTINEVLNDTLFHKLMEVDFEILAVNDTTLPDLSEDYTNSLIEILNLTTNVDSSINLFNQAGINNSEALFNLFGLKFSKCLELFENSTVFKSIPIDSAASLLEKSVIQYRKEINSVRMNDECSEAYAAGMEECEDNFAIGFAWGLGSGVVATMFGSPLAGAATVTSQIGAAYLQNIVCRRGVVRQWKICRSHQ